MTRAVRGRHYRNGGVPSTVASDGVRPDCLHRDGIGQVDAEATSLFYVWHFGHQKVDRPASTCRSTTPPHGHGSPSRP